jgi:hypothetical protein
VGHDLAELMRRCKTAGLSCEQETEQLIERFSGGYKRKLWEYTEVTGMVFPKPQLLRAALDQVLRAVADHVWGGSVDAAGQPAERGLEIRADWAAYYNVPLACSRQL